jgi:hypothetical protein
MVTTPLPPPDGKTRLAGLPVKDHLYEQAKWALIARAVFIVMVCGFAVPERSPENPVSTYPGLAVAVTVTVVEGS